MSHNTLLKAIWRLLKFEITALLHSVLKIHCILKERQCLERKEISRKKRSSNLRCTRAIRQLCSRYLTIVFQQLFLELRESEPVLWGAGAVVIKTHLVQLNPQEKHRHWYKLLPKPGVAL